jgi:hypothetical protein
VRAVPSFIEVETMVKVIPLNVRQNENTPTIERLAILAVHDGGREPAMLGFVGVHGQPQLFQASGYAVASFLNVLVSLPAETETD